MCKQRNNLNGSQFAIVIREINSNPRDDLNYYAFGTMLNNFDTVVSLEQLKVDDMGMLIDNLVISGCEVLRDDDEKEA